MEETTAPSAFTARIHGFIARRWLLLVLALVTHAVVVHYFFLGFVTWDGFGHRVPPVIELMKFGSLNADKFNNWALMGYRPFVELSNIPFLALLGMDGLYFAFAALVPFGALAIFALVREVTGDRDGGLYAAGAYLVAPIVTSQLFSGYIDWSIPALLAFFLYALLVVDRGYDKRPWLRFVQVTVATFLFTMARQQAPYLSIGFAAVILYLRFVERSGLRFRLSKAKTVVAALGAYVIGVAPAGIAQAIMYRRHGSPIYPFEFSFLGLKIGKGVPFKDICWYAGLVDYTPKGFLKFFLGSWVLPDRWPYAFFDSRHFGVGFLFLLGLLSTPAWWPRANRTTRALVVMLLAGSVAARDFWLPRYSFLLLLLVFVTCGLGLAALRASKNRTVAALYVAAIGLTGLHALSPEWELYRLGQGDWIPRLNIAQSRVLSRPEMVVTLYPDLNAPLVIVESPSNGFALPLYGRKLTNTVVGTIFAKDLGERCEGARAYLEKTPGALFVDDSNHTKACARECVATADRCLAYRLLPAAPL